MTTSRESFNRQCFEFTSRWRQLTDGWHLMRIDPGGHNHLSIVHHRNFENLWDLELMLTKTEIKGSIDENRVWTREYTVVYSTGYEVPVMYFNISNQDGSPVRLEDGLPESVMVTHGHHLQSAVNQVEHPILYRPFYMIHPCRTRDLMDLHETQLGDNYLITWLSSVATLLDLNLHPELGDLVELDVLLGCRNSLTHEYLSILMVRPWRLCSC